MFQTIDEIFRACHRLPALRIRTVKRPVGKAFVFAGVVGLVVLLGAFALL